MAVSRRVFKFLMARVPWYGPIYHEAFRLEQRAGLDSAALDIVERGLLEIPRYGPLWFGAFRVCERLDAETQECGEYKSNRHTVCWPKTGSCVEQRSETYSDMC